MGQLGSTVRLGRFDYSMHAADALPRAVASKQVDVWETKQHTSIVVHVHGKLRIFAGVSAASPYDPTRQRVGREKTKLFTPPRHLFRLRLAYKNP